MGNNTNMKGKNFCLPKVDLSQDVSKKLKVICGKSLQDIPIKIDPKFKYNTFNLKTQKAINPDSKMEFDSINSLKILTYNIWFEQHNVQNRMKVILQIIKQADADIICLQQVTQSFMQLLWKNSKQLCEKGDLFLPAVPMHWYDTIILSKFPMNFYQVPFKQSTMNRNLLTGIFQVITAQNQILNCSINCVHLESLNNQKLRILQLKDISEVNKNMDIVVVAGDMNFSDDWPEDKVIQSEYIDAWHNFQQKNIDKWTMPSTLYFPEWRPDHILIKSNKLGNKELIQSKKFQGKIGRVGAFTIVPFEDQQLLNISKDGIVRTASDHIGLLANFRF